MSLPWGDCLGFAAQPEDLDVKMPWVHGMSWIQEPAWPYWRLPKEKGGEEEDDGRSPWPTWVGDKCARPLWSSLSITMHGRLQGRDRGLYLSRALSVGTPGPCRVLEQGTGCRELVTRAGPAGSKHGTGRAPRVGERCVSGGRGAMEYDASDDVTFTRNLDSSQAVNVVEYLLFTKIVVSARCEREACLAPPLQHFLPLVGLMSLPCVIFVMQRVVWAPARDAASQYCVEGLDLYALAGAAVVAETHCGLSPACT